MSFNAKNPLIAPSVDSIPPTPPKGTRGIFATPEGWMDIDSDGTVRKLGGDGSGSGVVDQTYNPDSKNAQSGVALKPVIDSLNERLNLAWEAVMVCDSELIKKADKTTISTGQSTSYEFPFVYLHNYEIRQGEMNSVSFTFGNGEYRADYISGLSFDSGEAPTAIDYAGSGILNWVGTDCHAADGLSIFQPSANTHYDIVFYFNGTQFIGLVNGFVPATGNEAV